MQAGTLEEELLLPGQLVLLVLVLLFLLTWVATTSAISFASPWAGRLDRLGAIAAAALLPLLLRLPEGSRDGSESTTESVGKTRSASRAVEMRGEGSV